MLKRCLGLCLTDRKGAIASPQSIDFDLFETSKALSMSFYQPLASLCHSQRLIGSFKRDVLSRVKQLISLHRAAGLAGNQGASCLPALRQPFLVHKRQRLTDADLMICLTIVEEFLLHSESLLLSVEANLRNVQNPSLLAFCRRCNARIEDLRKQWRLIVSGAELPISDVLRQIARTSDSTSGLPDESVVLDETAADAAYQQHARKARFTRSLVSWREQWKIASSGFGPGARFKFKQTRYAPALFELWCFMELANTMYSTGRESLVQCSLLRGSDDTPLFRGSEGMEVFYDFHGTRQICQRNTQVLKRVHIEWLLRNRTEESKDVIIDTKYKASESINHLTTLGYMLAFQVQRGVVIFRENLDSNAFHCAEADDRFVLCRFGANREQTLCALHLVPKQTEMARNSLALQKLLDLVVEA